MSIKILNLLHQESYLELQKLSLEELKIETIKASHQGVSLDGNTGWDKRTFFFFISSPVLFAFYYIDSLFKPFF